MKARVTLRCLVVQFVGLGITAVAGSPRGTERSFERSFAINGPAALDALTNSGRVEVRVGANAAVVVRGTIKRNVSWRGVQVTDEQIARLRSAPPVRLDGTTVRIERMVDESLWRGVAIDYEIVVPATATIRIVTESGAVSITGTHSDVHVATGSGALRANPEAGHVDLQSGSGSVRVEGAMESLSVQTQSGSIGVGVDAVAAVDVSSGSGSIDVSGVRGTLHAETGSGRITLDGSPTGDWMVRSRSGSVSIRVPADSRFDVSARSRSGSVKAAFAVAGPTSPSKHSVEGAVNGGGPKLDVETGSSSITLMSSGSV